jgi:hypothetical protein
MPSPEVPAESERHSAAPSAQTSVVACNNINEEISESKGFGEYLKIPEVY